jgi:hypothetical protein
MTYEDMLEQADTLHTVSKPYFGLVSSIHMHQKYSNDSHIHDLKSDVAFQICFQTSTTDSTHASQLEMMSLVHLISIPYGYIFLSKNQITNLRPYIMPHKQKFRCI